MARRVVISLLLVVFALGVGSGIKHLLERMQEDPEQAGTGRPDIVVRVRTATPGTYAEMLSGYGQARALRRGEVAAEVPGIVTWISPRLEAGAAVTGPRSDDAGNATGGEVLVRLDDRDLQRAAEDARARRAQAEASVTRAKASLSSIGKRLVVARRDLVTSQEEMRRIETLLKTDTATVSERDRQRLETALRERAVLDLEGQRDLSEADIRRAEADEQSARAKERRAAQDLERTIIRSPYDGRIEARHVELGSRVAPGNVLFTIIDPSRVEVAVALGGSHFGEVAMDAAAVLRLRDDGPEIWSGRVSRIAPTVDPIDRTFSVYLVIETDDGSPAPVPSGAFVLARIEGAKHADVIVVPRMAFVGEHLYVAAREPGAESGKDLTIARVRTPVVRRWLTDVVLVDGGVEAGERIVVTNLEDLAHGSRIRVAPESAPAGAASR
jgi:RND family efflux transporter MFP subunit